MIRVSRRAAAAVIAAGALVGIAGVTPASAATALPRPTGLTTTPIASLDGKNVPCGQHQPYGYIGLTTGGDVGLNATVTSTATGMLVAAEYQLWPVTSPASVTDVTTPMAASGSVVDATIPGSVFADGVTYAWRARTVSGAETSPWTPPCHFIRDLESPPGPAISSATFPSTGSTPVRTYGTFTFSVPTPTRVVGFDYVLNGELSVDGNPYVPIGRDGTATTPPLASGLWGTNTLTVRSVDVAGNVSQPVTYTFQLSPPAAPDKYGDLNGDGVPDLVSVGSDGYLYYSQGLPDGGVAAPVRETAPAPDRLVTGWAGAQVSVGGDFDQDGYQDMVVIQNNNMYVYSGTGLGDFYGSPTFVEPPTGQSNWAGATQIVATGDLNGDGSADLLVKQGDQLYFLAGEFGAFFADPVAVAGTGWAGMTVVGVADVNGDGTPDLIARDDATGAIWLYAGAGDGTFGDASTRVQIGSGLSAAAFPLVETKGDLNGDGTVDIRAVGADRRLYLIPGLAAGGFGTPTPVTGTGFWPGATDLG